MPVGARSARQEISEPGRATDVIPRPRKTRKMVVLPPSPPCHTPPRRPVIAHRRAMPSTMALAAAHPGALVRAARAGASALQRASSRAPPAFSPPRLRGACRASVPCPRVAVTSPASTSADEEPFGAPSHGSGAGVPDLASLTDPAELDLLVNLLPPKVRGTLSEHPRKLSLLEVVLDLGRRPIARFADGDEFLSEDVLDYADIERALENVGEIGGDNRAGINRTLHRISVIRNRAGGVVGLTCRVGRAISGGADLVCDLIDAGASVLLLRRKISPCWLVRKPSNDGRSESWLLPSASGPTPSWAPDRCFVLNGH